MPHDMNGQELKVGDRVLIPAVVEQISTNPQYCNLTVKLTEVMPGYTESMSLSCLNTKQVAKGILIEEEPT